MLINEKLKTPGIGNLFSGENHVINQELLCMKLLKTLQISDHADIIVTITLMMIFLFGHANKIIQLTTTQVSIIGRNSSCLLEVARNLQMILSKNPLP